MNIPIRITHAAPLTLAASDAGDERWVPEPIHIPSRGGPCSLRSFNWGPTFTPGERAAHLKAKRLLIEQGGVPNIWSNPEFPTPQPWLGVRRLVLARWIKAFKDKRPAERHELLAYVAWQIAETFTAERIRAEPGRVVRFAETLVEREIADVCKGRRRKRSGLLTIMNDPKRSKQYADSPVWGDDGFDGPKDGPGGERNAEGICPVAVAAQSSPNEDELIDAIDIRKAAARIRDCESTNGKFNTERKLFLEIWGPQWTSYV